jgi:hypothetical protein
MSIITTTMDVVAGLSVALGAISLMNEGYRWIAARKVEGRIVAYEPVLDSQDKPTRAMKARFAYRLGDSEVEHSSNSSSYEEDAAAHPVGSIATIRYLPSNPDVPEFAPTLKESFLFPVGALLVGAGLFVLSGFLG